MFRLCQKQWLRNTECQPDKKFFLRPLYKSTPDFHCKNWSTFLTYYIWYYLHMKWERVVSTHTAQCSGENELPANSCFWLRSSNSSTQLSCPAHSVTSILSLTFNALTLFVRWLGITAVKCCHHPPRFFQTLSVISLYLDYLHTHTHFCGKPAQCSVMLGWSLKANFL